MHKKEYENDELSWTKIMCRSGEVEVDIFVKSGTSQIAIVIVRYFVNLFYEFTKNYFSNFLILLLLMR